MTSENYEAIISMLLDKLEENNPETPFIFHLNHGNTETTDYMKVQRFIDLYEERIAGLVKERDDAVRLSTYWKEKSIVDKV